MAGSDTGLKTRIFLSEAARTGLLDLAVALREPSYSPEAEQGALVLHRAGSEELGRVQLFARAYAASLPQNFDVIELNDCLVVCCGAATMMRYEGTFFSASITYFHNEEDLRFLHVVPRKPPGGSGGGVIVPLWPDDDAEHDVRDLTAPMLACSGYGALGLDHLLSKAAAHCNVGASTDAQIDRDVVEHDVRDLTAPTQAHSGDGACREDLLLSKATARCNVGASADVASQSAVADYAMKSTKDVREHPMNTGGFYSDEIVRAVVPVSDGGVDSAAHMENGGFGSMRGKVISLFGKPGVGKTHLAMSLAEAVRTVSSFEQLSKEHAASATPRAVFTPVVITPSTYTVADVLIDRLVVRAFVIGRVDAKRDLRRIDRFLRSSRDPAAEALLRMMRDVYAPTVVACAFAPAAKGRGFQRTMLAVAACAEIAGVDTTLLTTAGENASLRTWAAQSALAALVRHMRDTRRHVGTVEMAVPVTAPAEFFGIVDKGALFTALHEVGAVAMKHTPARRSAALCDLFGGVPSSVFALDERSASDIAFSFDAIAEGSSPETPACAKERVGALNATLPPFKLDIAQIHVDLGLVSMSATSPMSG